jgi:hypothetical protein
LRTGIEDIPRGAGHLVRGGRHHRLDLAGDVDGAGVGLARLGAEVGGHDVEAIGPRHGGAHVLDDEAGDVLQADGQRGAVAGVNRVLLADEIGDEDLDAGAGGHGILDPGQLDQVGDDVLAVTQQGGRSG